MDLSDAKIAKRREKMTALLARLQGQEGKAAQAGSAGYAHGRSAVAPQAFRPKSQDPLQRMARWVQAALAVVLGIKLPLTGVIDSATRAALLAFQKQHGLPQSGAVDSRTLEALENAVGLPAPTKQEPANWMEQERARPQKPKAKGGTGGDDNKGQAVDAAGDLVPADGAGQDPGGQERHTFENDQSVYGEADAHALRVGHLGKAPPLSKVADASQAATDHLLHSEAMHAVMTLAFERSWIRDELQRLGRQGESALLAELLGFWERARKAGPQAPAWMIAAASQAKEQQDHAVQLVRQAWQKEQPNP